MLWAIVHNAGMGGMVVPGHKVHMEDPGRLYAPAEHIVMELEELAEGHAKPAGQAVQLAAPSLLYCPEGHGLPVPLKEPAVHM